MGIVLVKDPITLEIVESFIYFGECGSNCGYCDGCRLSRLSAEGYILEVRK